MIQRGDVHFIDLNPTRGREQAGRRPVLVLSVDEINALPLVVTIVVGTKGPSIVHDYPTNVRVPPESSGLPLETVFLCFQIRSVDASRFPNERAGKMDDEYMAKVEDAVRYCLGL